MQARKLIILLVNTCLLAGCLNSPQKANDVKQIDFVPSSTMAPNLTVVTTSTASLPTLTPTSTVTPPPPAIPTLASNKNSDAYQLTRPSPEGLLRLINIVNTQHGYLNSHYGYEDNAEFDFMLNELSDMRDVIDAEIKFYYPDGFPKPEIIWNYYPPNNDEWFFYFPSAYLDTLTDAVFNDLNHKYYKLKDKEVIDGNSYKVTSYQVELDHDLQPEWLIRIDWENITALSWLVLDQNPDQTYTRLSLSLPNELWFPPTWDERIDALQDITGDGLTDIVLVNQGYALGTDFFKFHIANGTKDGFQELRSVSKSISVTVAGNSDYYKIETPSGSKWLTLTLYDPHNINWGCAWETETSYRWPYGREQIVVVGKDIPRTPECSLARSVSVYDPVDNNTAINLLENAISHFDEKDIDQRGKLLFAHYRLAILYALLDKDSLARQHLEWLVQYSTEADERYLREKVTLLLEEKKVNAIKLCDSMYHAAESKIPEGWKNYLDATASVHAYPYSNEIYPPAICPLREIITQKINQVDLSPQSVSEKALIDEGIPVVSIQKYPTSDHERSATFLLIGANTLYVLGYVPTMEGWEWRLMTSFDAVDSLPQSFFQDVTGDGFPELAYFQRSQYWFCPENEDSYEIFLTTFSGFGFVSLGYTVCHPKDEPFDITNYLPDTDKDGVVDWVADQIEKAAGDEFLTAERESPATWFTPDEISSMIPQEGSNDDGSTTLISELYKGNNPSGVRQKLMVEQDALNPADQLAGREWQRLTYLIAVSYELEGRTDKAIEMFVSILRSEDQTLWGNLAELHLVTK